MEGLVYFGKYGSADGIPGFSRRGEFVPLDMELDRLSSRMLLRLSTGEIVDVTTRLIVHENRDGKPVVLGDSDLYEKVMLDFRRKQHYDGMRRRDAGGEKVVFGNLRKEGGKVALDVQGTLIPFLILTRGERKYAVLQNGLWVDAESLEFVEGERGGISVVGSEELFHRLRDNYSDAQSGRQGLAHFGRYIKSGEGEFLRVGEALIRLNRQEVAEDRHLLVLSDGRTIPMDEVRLAGAIGGLSHMWGPSWMLKEIMDDFGKQVRKAKEKEDAPGKVSVEKSAEYEVLKTPAPRRGWVGKLIAAAAFAALVLVSGIMFRSHVPSGASQKAAPPPEIVQAAQQEDAKKKALDELVAAAERRQEMVRLEAQKKQAAIADTIDLNLKENREIARKQGFSGIARKMYPNVPRSELGKKIAEIARQNLKPDHKDINMWSASDLKTPGKIISPRMAIVN